MSKMTTEARSMLDIDLIYEALVRGKNWPQAREKALRRDEFRCQKPGCGQRQGLEVHHKRPFRTFEDYREANNLSNLITLCRVHHEEMESMVQHKRAHRNYYQPKKPEGYQERRQQNHDAHKIAPIFPEDRHRNTRVHARIDKKKGAKTHRASEDLIFYKSSIASNQSLLVNSSTTPREKTQTNYTSRLISYASAFLLLLIVSCLLFIAGKAP